MSNPFLSLIIPCYRQEKTIVQNIEQVLSTLDKTRYSYEVIIVIDGRYDNSWHKLHNAKIFNVVVYEYAENRGKSFAIRFGMNKAKGEHVMFLDSGLEINPDG